MATPSPLGTADLRRMPTEVSRAEDEDRQCRGQPLEAWIQLSLQPGQASFSWVTVTGDKEACPGMAA